MLAATVGENQPCPRRCRENNPACTGNACCRPRHTGWKNWGRSPHSFDKKLIPLFLSAFSIWFLGKLSAGRSVPGHFQFSWSPESCSWIPAFAGMTMACGNDIGSCKARSVGVRRAVSFANCHCEGLKDRRSERPRQSQQPPPDKMGKPQGVSVLH